MTDKKKKKEKKRKVGRPRKQHYARKFPVPDVDEAIIKALDMDSLETAEINGEGKGKGNVWLRKLAELQYVTSQKFVTLEQLNRDEKFKHLSQGTLQFWSIQDQWVEKRKEYFERLKVKLEQKIGNALVQAHYRQLRDLDEISEQMKNMLRRNVVAPKSFEGLVQALLHVEEFRRSERLRLAGDVVNNTVGGEGGGGSANQITPDLSDDEARHIATEIMKLRQRKIREKLSVENKVADEDPDLVEDYGETVE